MTFHSDSEIRGGWGAFIYIGSFYYRYDRRLLKSSADLQSWAKIFLSRFSSPLEPVYWQAVRLLSGFLLRGGIHELRIGFQGIAKICCQDGFLSGL